MRFGIQAGLFGNPTLEKGLERIRAAGYDGVEWTWGDVGAPCGLVSGDANKKILEGAKKIRRMSEKFGLEAVSVTPGILPNFADEPEVLEAHFEGIRESGAKFLRMFAPVYVGILKPGNRFEKYYDGRKDYHTLAKDFNRHLEVLCRMGEEHNVRVLFEMHDGYCPSSCSGYYLLLKNYSPGHIGVIYDPENMIREGMENWRMSIEMIYPYLGYVHVKNMIWVRGKGMSPPQHMKKWGTQRVGLDDGIVDWCQIIYFLKKHGFEGYLVDEDFSRGKAEDRFENISYLRGLVKQEKDPWDKWFNWGKEA